MSTVSKKYNAFSYLEVTMVVGIFSLATFFLVPISFSQIASARTSYYASDLNAFLFSSQQSSYTQLSGSAHGVRVNTNSYDVFTGSSYATATDSQTITMNNSVVFSEVSLTEISTGSPTSEIVYDRGNFKPNAYGTITLTDGSALYRVTINIEGLTYYERL